MRQFTTALFIVLLTGSLANARQHESFGDGLVYRAKNAAYFEFLGSGLNASFNFERFFSDKFSVRAGLGAYGFNTTEQPSGFQWVPVLPVVFNYYIGNGSDRLELGAGAIIHLTDHGWETMFPSLSDAAVKATITIGYRYQPSQGGFNAGIGFTPVTDFRHIAPWMGFYLGWGF